jgi:hypothetical protein
MIPDYKAARLGADEQEAGGQESRDSERTAKVKPGSLATLRSRLAR